MLCYPVDVRVTALRAWGIDQILDPHLFVNKEMNNMMTNILIEVFVSGILDCFPSWILIILMLVILFTQKRNYLKRTTVKPYQLSYDNRKY